jgi:hypothetical protein
MIIPLFLQAPAATVHAGNGLYLRTIGRGRRRRSTLYGRNTAAFFAGAFYFDGTVTDGVIEGSMTKGYVNGLEPAFKGNPISSGMIKGQVQGDKTWICLKVRIDEGTGRMVATKQEEVADDNLGLEFCDNPRGGQGEATLVGYAPLVVVDTTDGLPTIHQIAYFSYRHSAGKRGGPGPAAWPGWRHFFHVA